MDSSSSSDITVVNRKIRGMLRENSLYYFMRDQLREEPLRSFHVQTSDTEQRNALYVHIPVTPQQLNLAFPGFELKRQHLSVDRLVINAESPFSRRFFPSHCTFEYESERELLVVHAYFNRNALLSDFQLKTHAIEPENRGRSEGRDRLLTDREKDNIRKNIAPFHDLLGQLLNKKASTYVDLYKQSFQIDDEIADALKSNHLEQAMKKIAELQDLTQRLTQYNDAETDGRTTHLTRLLEHLSDREQAGRHLSSETPSKDCSSAQPTTEEVSAEQPTMTQSVMQKKPKEYHQTLMDNIRSISEDVIAFCNRAPEVKLSLKLIEIEPQLDSLDDLFLELELKNQSKSKKIVDFIRQQRAKLPINTTLRNYFNERVLAGDMDSVNILFPVVSGRVNMAKLSYELINTIENHSDPRGCAELINIADFFYEQSESYRSQMVLSSQIYCCYNGEKKQIVTGLLFNLFKNNNMLGFDMALRQGISPDSLQFMTNNVWFTALQSLIINYSMNSNIDFIKTLMKYGAQVTFKTNNAAQVVPPSLVKTMFKKSQLYFPSHLKIATLNDVTDLETTDLQAKVSTIPNGLRLARIRHGAAYPELLIEMAEHQSIEALLLEATTLVNTQRFNSRFVTRPAGSSNTVFRSVDECNDTYFQLQAMNVPGFCFLFYINTAWTDENSALFTCGNHLLTKAKEGFSRLPIDEQRGIMTSFLDKAKHKKSSGLLLEAFFCFNTAQMAYTMIRSPLTRDHEAMLQIFALKAKMALDHSIGSSHAAYLDAFTYLQQLPAAALAALKQTPIYSHVKNKIDKTIPADIMRHCLS